MNDLSRVALEGVIVDDEVGVERFCQALIETTTEFDWHADSEHSIPEYLRDGLRAWVRQFHAWDREVSA